MKFVMFSFLIGMTVAAPAFAETADDGGFYISPAAGVMIMNHGSSRGGVKNTPFQMTLRFGYDFANSPWSLEAGLLLAPDIETRGASGANMIGGGFSDALYHFNRYQRLDPFLSAGLGYFRANDGAPFTTETQEFGALRLGAGLMYHLTDKLSLRADFRYNMAMHNDCFAFETVDAGLVYRFGGSSGCGEVTSIVPPPVVDEVVVVENPAYNEDLQKKFDGVVTDTTPVNAEDYMKLEVRVTYDWDTSIIKPEFYPALNEISRVIAKARAANPNVTIDVEGHADRRRNSSAKHNMDLSIKRAEGVRDYLVDQGIPVAAMTTKGYGFTRPLVTPDLEKGNPENRRVEVYIRGVGNADSRNLLRTN